MRKLTQAQQLLRTHLQELGYEVECEYQFCADRRWRADIAIPSERLLVECDGGQFRGGHRRGLALERDYEKQNKAQIDGWRILRWTNRQILKGEAIAWLKEQL